MMMVMVMRVMMLSVLCRVWQRSSWQTSQRPRAIANYLKAMNSSGVETESLYRLTHITSERCRQRDTEAGMMRWHSYDIIIIVYTSRLITLRVVWAASDTGHLRSIQRDCVSLAKRNWRNSMWQCQNGGLKCILMHYCKVNTWTSLYMWEISVMGALQDSQFYYKNVCWSRKYFVAS